MLGPTGVDGAIRRQRRSPASAAAPTGVDRRMRPSPCTRPASSAALPSPPGLPSMLAVAVSAGIAGYAGPRPPLPVHARHVGVAVALRLASLVERLEVLVAQLHGERADVLLEVTAPLRARDGNDVLALRVHPRERDLGRRGVLLGRQRVDPLDDRDVRLEVVSLHARLAPAEVVLRELVERAQPAGQEAAAERAVGHEADTELAQRGEYLRLDLAGPDRVLALQRGDRV